MKTLFRRGAPPLLLVLGLALVAAPAWHARGAAATSPAATPPAATSPAAAANTPSAAAPPAGAAKRYVCVPCGLPCDARFFNAPGVCPECGMALVEEGSAAARPAVDPGQKKVAILIFSGCEILDYTGPYEMFGAAGCDVYTVAADRNVITTAMGMTVVPKYAFADAPQPDVLVIPGGGVKAASNDAATLRYIKEVTEHATNTMSVCNGAFILANTGLLDGLSATTTYGNLPRLASSYPKIKVVRDQRYVDNGKLITTAGLSAGMDGALHVIARLYGEGYAQQVALGEEYDWKATSGYARAALADHEIPQIDMDALGKWEVVHTEGDTQHWDIAIKGHSELAADELAKRMEQTLADGNWSRVGPAKSDASTHASDWRFTGSDGKPWRASLRIGKIGSSAHDFTAGLTVDRATR